jgi:hypothetical protein
LSNFSHSPALSELRMIWPMALHCRHFSVVAATSRSLLRLMIVSSSLAAVLDQGKAFS